MKSNHDDVIDYDYLALLPNVIEYEYNYSTQKLAHEYQLRL